MENLKSVTLKYLASVKDADLIDRAGIQNHTALRTAKQLRLEPQKVREIFQILIQDGLVEKRSAKYCGAARYFLTSKGQEVAKL
jgi:hypothetical protein